MGRAFIVCGSPGAGKTTYGRELAARRRAAFLDIDTVTESLVRLALHKAGRDADDRDSPYFKRTFRAPIYETLFAVARENLPWVDVVIAGPFTREIRDPGWPATLEATLQAPVAIHYVYCRPPVRRERLERRGNPRDAQKLADWEQHLAYYGDEGGEERPPAFPHVFVDRSDER